MSGSQEPSAEHPVWPVWRDVVAGFTVLTVLRQAVSLATIFGVYSLDFASSLRRSRMARWTFARLEHESDAMLADLIALAEVNEKRNEAMWRLSVIFYVTVPVTLVLAVLEAVPEAVVTLFATRYLFLWGLAAMMTGFLIYYFLTQWRARQIVAVLDLVRMERGLR